MIVAWGYLLRTTGSIDLTCLGPRRVQLELGGTELEEKLTGAAVGSLVVSMRLFALFTLAHL